MNMILLGMVASCLVQWSIGLVDILRDRTTSRRNPAISQSPKSLQTALVKRRPEAKVCRATLPPKADCL